MSDILDLIRAKLVEQPVILAAMEPVLSEVRMEYGGETVYIRSEPPILNPITRLKIQRVTQRTIQRRKYYR